VVLDIILILIESVFNSSSSLLFLKQLSISGVPLIDETIQIHRVMPVVWNLCFQVSCMPGNFSFKFYPKNFIQKTFYPLMCLNEKLITHNEPIKESQRVQKEA